MSKVPFGSFDIFTMKASSSGCADCVLARKAGKTFDDQAEYEQAGR